MDAPKTLEELNAQFKSQKAEKSAPAFESMTDDTGTHISDSVMHPEIEPYEERAYPTVESGNPLLSALIIIVLIAVSFALGFIVCSYIYGYTSLFK